MEEELSDNELEGRMYAMLHYVDQTQPNLSINQKDTIFVNNVNHSTLRRYWHTNNDQNTTYQKINTPKESATGTKVVDVENEKGNENNQSPSPDLSIFQQPISNNIKKTIEILENEDLNRVVELESSDEDEVIEVALPPKPTITIESSDEEETNSISQNINDKKSIDKDEENKISVVREVTASPVPSVVSSVSDEFIRGDCIALNISSKSATNQSFDFNLHGSDLLVQTPTRKRKKKKTNKDNTSTPITAPIAAPISTEECFATPKSKAKNKRQKTKSVSEKTIPNVDVYDSDSNQSTNEGNRSSYSVTDKSLPHTDVYESDSNQSEIVKDVINDKIADKESNGPNISSSKTITSTPNATGNNDSFSDIVVDLTTFDSFNTTINENIIMGNVSGFTDVDSYNDENIHPQDHHQDIPKCGSTKIPAILNEDLDFDNLKGINSASKRRRYSLSSLRAEMEKFYNESWGGENFNHREIQKNMSRDKSLWVIDPKDKMSSFSKRKSTCNYCNRGGHRDDTCRMKPPVCFMCGLTGHFEPRCPRKICVNCGSPNHMYTNMCRNCSNWNAMRCMECGQNGHPSSHCPDLWRRYHNTINLGMPLEENRQFKKYYQTFCSGCTRRGHLVHTCRTSLPFSGLPINSPYVAVYRPVYSQIVTNDCIQHMNSNIHKQLQNKCTAQDSEVTAKNERTKRKSKSPSTYDIHVNKKKKIETPGDRQIDQSPNAIISIQKKNQHTKEPTTTNNKDPTETSKITKTTDSENSERSREIAPVQSDNHDEKGHMIQDNEVSDTSDVVTTAKIFITKQIASKLNDEEGIIWMKEAIKRNNVMIENDDVKSYLSITGTDGNKEAFHAELRDWFNNKEKSKERAISESDVDITLESVNDQYTMSNDIPKNRNNVIRKLTRAFEALKTDIGDPKALHKELVYLRNRHQQLQKQKVVSPQQLSNNRANINSMLKKLNMVLLGQAGLADGSKHLTELHQLHDKLTSYRQKNIPISLREEIGQHFHCIFAATQRDDYAELLSKYYNKPSTALKKKHFTNSNNHRNNALNTVQDVQKLVGKNDDNMIIQNETPITKVVMEKMKNKLLFYYKRLTNSRPMDNVLKKTKTELTKQVHRFITLYGKKNYTNKRNFRRMKKVQEQVQLYLSNM